MQSSRYSSSDVPDFSTYPASPADEPLRAPEVPREIAMGAKYVRDETTLEERARRIGWSLGRLVNSIRYASEQVQKTLDRAASTARETTSSAPNRMSELADTARQKLSEGLERAVLLRRRAVQEYPVQIILGAAVAGVIAGVGLRVWRENRG